MAKKNSSEFWHFVFEDFHKLLEKVEWEFDKFCAASNSQEEDYLMYNIVLSLNHLFDWVIEDPKIDDEVKKACLLRFHPYLRREKVNGELSRIYQLVADLPNVNLRQLVVRKVANYAKHLSANYALLGFQALGKAIRTYFVSINLETDEQRKLTREEMEKAYGPHLPELVEQWVNDPKAIYEVELVGDVLRPLIAEWKNFASGIQIRP